MFDNFMLLTKQGGILKPFAFILGIIMEGIFNLLYLIGIPNIGLTIILFTIVIYLLMLPLTVKQQKFSKLSSIMNPEIQAIQMKYRGKSDQDSMMKMQQETQMVYQKYGVSPSGSCLQLLIQMPILFALYRVIYNIPAYVSKVRIVFDGVINDLIATPGSLKFVKSLDGYSMYKKSFSGINIDDATKIINKSCIPDAKNAFIDVLNRCSTSEWGKVSKWGVENGIDNFADTVSKATAKLDDYNNFLGLNIANSPSFIISQNKGHILVILGVLLIPVLAALTQWINTLLIPKPANDDNTAQNAVSSSMKTMNVIMPIMSAVFCYTLPVGMGLYWIAGSVVRSVLQVVINKRLDKVDVDEMIKLNIEKANAKRAKVGLPAMQISNNATMNTRNVAPKPEKPRKTDEERAASIKDSTEFYKNKNASKEGSLASKAMMVKQYNEKNTK